MSVGLLPMAPIVARLEAAARPAIHRVTTAADVAAALNPSAIPAGSSMASVVVLGAEPRQIREGSGPVRQVLDVTFSVVVGIGLAGAAGAAGIERLEGPLNAVRDAIFGWLHPRAEEVCAHAGERLEDFDPKTGALFYSLDFTTNVILRKASS